MAVDIRCASVLAVCLLGCFLQVLSQVFRGAPGAHTVFLRPRRANQFLLEEILQGNLERECYEERCNFEEAREVFENDQDTITFWTVYYDGDQCLSNPCFNQGNCTDKVGGFTCACSPPHYGHTCELGAPPVLVLEEREQASPQYKAPAVVECPNHGPGACHQLCAADFYSYKCSCLSGFKLQSDMRSCQPEAQFPCGRIPDADSSTCCHGNSPWQVSLINSSGVEFCGGAVLGVRSVLTSARCLFGSGVDLRPSHLRAVAGNRKEFAVRAMYFHHRFQLDHHNFDLALLELATPLVFGPALSRLCLPTKDFSENILMHSGRQGEADRKRPGQSQELVYMTLDDCRRDLTVHHELSNKMFCMRRGGSEGGAATSTNQRQHRPLRRQKATQKRLGLDQNQSETEQILTATWNGSENSSHESPAGGSRLGCSGLMPGSPVVTVEKGTAFLTGLLLSASSHCDGLVFTKVSRYLNWIRPRLQLAEDHMTPQVHQYPEV